MFRKDVHLSPGKESRKWVHGCSAGSRFQRMETIRRNHFSQFTFFFLRTLWSIFTFRRIFLFPFFRSIVCPRFSPSRQRQSCCMWTSQYVDRYILFSFLLESYVSHFSICHLSFSICKYQVVYSSTINPFFLSESLFLRFLMFLILLFLGGGALSFCAFGLFSSFDTLLHYYVYVLYVFFFFCHF